MEVNTDAQLEQPGNISMDALIRITYSGNKPTVEERCTRRCR
jgi:hypothetical protein